MNGKPTKPWVDPFYEGSEAPDAHISAQDRERRGRVITFLGVVRDRDGDRLEIEVLAPPNVGTPMHLHHLQEEAITVVAGKLGLQFAGEPPRYAEAGETLILKRGVGHRWWN